MRISDWSSDVCSSDLITYLSEAGLTEKFGRRLQGRPENPNGSKTFGFDADFQVESYLRHQGLSFVERFDANSYLYITRAMDYNDIAEDHGGRSEEHTSELQSLMRISYAVFCLKKNNTTNDK